MGTPDSPMEGVREGRREEITLWSVEDIGRSLATYFSGLIINQ